MVGDDGRQRAHADPVAHEVNVLAQELLEPDNRRELCFYLTCTQESAKGARSDHLTITACALHNCIYTYVYAY